MKYIIVMDLDTHAPLENMTIEEFMNEQWEQTPAWGEGDRITIRRAENALDAMTKYLLKLGEGEAQ